MLYYAAHQAMPIPTVESMILILDPVSNGASVGGAVAGGGPGGPEGGGCGMGPSGLYDPDPPAGPHGVLRSYYEPCRES